MPVFHRLYWVPSGMEASDGVYVRYPAEELYAALHPGLAPPRHAPGRRGPGHDPAGGPRVDGPARRPPHVCRPVRRRSPTRRPPCRRPLAASVASLNTHDMPPFAAYLTGADIGSRRARPAGRPGSDRAARGPADAARGPPRVPPGSGSSRWKSRTPPRSSGPVCPISRPATPGSCWRTSKTSGSRPTPRTSRARGTSTRTGRGRRGCPSRNSARRNRSWENSGPSSGRGGTGRIRRHWRLLPGRVASGPHTSRPH